MVLDRILLVAVPSSKANSENAFPFSIFCTMASRNRRAKKRKEAEKDFFFREGFNSEAKRARVDEIAISAPPVGDSSVQALNVFDLFDFNADKEEIDRAEADGSEDLNFPEPASLTLDEIEQIFNADLQDDDVVLLDRFGNPMWSQEDRMESVLAIRSVFHFGNFRDDQVSIVLLLMNCLLKVAASEPIVRTKYQLDKVRAAHEYI